MGKKENSRRGRRLAGFAVIHAPSGPRPGRAFSVHHWSELAACLGQAEAFTKVLSIKAAPFWVRTEKELHAYNKEKLGAAVEVCKACPVLSQCKKSMEPDDRHADMVWAGYLPKRIGSAEGLRPAGRPLKEGEINPRRPYPCPRGHEGHWYQRQDGRWQCRECDRARSAAKRKGEKLPPVLSPRCPQGHEDWKYDKHNHRFCNTCKIFMDRQRRKTGSAEGFATLMK